jgi:hypothetical protein
MGFRTCQGKLYKSTIVITYKVFLEPVPNLKNFDFEKYTFGLTDLEHNFVEPIINI